MSTQFLDQLQSTLGSAYTLERELGGGGMSRVFVAREAALGRRVVVKVLPPELSEGLSTERFRREVQLAASLQHPLIVPVLAGGEAQGLLYYTMPYVEGESLAARLEREHELPIHDAVVVLHDVLAALAYAHARGVVHRDVKPANVLLSERHALVADFGIAKAVGAAARDTTLTAIGAAVGTPAYMAPEACAGDPAVDHRADLYAVGVVAYEMLAGRPPFIGGTAQQLIARHLVDAPEPLWHQRASIPRPLAELVMRLLEKRPADRPQSADLVLSELEALGEPGRRSGTGAPLAPSRAHSAGPSAHPRRARAWRWGLGAGLATGVALVALAVTLRSPGSAPTFDPRLVMVRSFENATGDASLDAVGRLASDYLEQGIARLRPIRLVGVTATTADPTAATRARRGPPAGATRAGTLVTGSYYGAGDSLEFRVRIVDANSGNVLATLDPVRAPRSDVSRALEPIQHRVLGGLAVITDTLFGAWALPAGPPPTYAAFQELAAGLGIFFGTRSSATKDAAEEIRAHLRRAASLDSAFLQPRIWLAWYHTVWFVRGPEADSLLTPLEGTRERLSQFERALVDALRATLRGEVVEAPAVWRRVAETSPMPYFRMRHVLALLNANRPREGLRVLEEGGGPPIRTSGRWATEAQIRHQLGEHSRELAAARKAQELTPQNHYNYFYELSALAALGWVEELERRIEDVLRVPADWSGGYTPGDVMRDAALELRAHGHVGAATRLLGRSLAWYEARPQDAEPLGRAFTLYALGRWREAGAYAARGAGTDSSGLFVPGLLARVAARLGDRAAADRALDELGARQRLGLRGWHTYERARIAAALGDRDRAVQLLLDAFSEGLGSRLWRTHADPDFVSMRDYPPLRKLLEPQG